MSERRGHRVKPRTDAQILAHPTDVDLLRRVQAGEVVNSSDLRMDLKRLAREELLLCGFAMGSKPTLLPRGEEVLARASWG